MKTTPATADLHVLMTTDAVGGVWTYAAILARRLCAGGARVTLVVQGPPPSEPQRRSLDGISGIDLVVTDHALEWLDPEGRDTARARRALERLARRVSPNVIHLNGYREAGADWPAPVLVVAHSCAQSWSLACRGARQAGAWEIYAAEVARGLDAADAWAAPTRSFRNVVETLYGPSHRGAVVHNGIEPIWPGMRKEPFVLAAGRLWDEAKNLELLIASAPDVEWPILVAGPMSLDETGAAGSPEAVRSLGVLQHDALIATMQDAGIFVSPALYEPFGLTVLEAAAAGCALVLSDVPTFRELWEGAALFVPARDANALTAALNRLCAGAQERRALQRAAAVRARRYGAERMANATVALYERLLAGGRFSDSFAPRPATEVRA